jgi:hypothetical protein
MSVSPEGPTHCRGVKFPQLRWPSWRMSAPKVLLSKREKPSPGKTLQF